MDKNKSTGKTPDKDASLILRTMNGPRDLFNVNAPLPRMGIEDYFLSAINGAYGKGQQELFPLSAHDQILKELMPMNGSRFLTTPNIMGGPVAVGRKEYIDYLVLQFDNAADKQMPLFSEAELPSAKSLKNFMGHPPGYRGLN